MTALLSDFREMVREQYEYRELLVQMTKRDLLLRYKQTAMGFAWAVFMPLVNTIIFSIIFTRVAPIETPVPYPLFAFCGLWAWNYTSSALKFGVNSLTSNTNLVSKVYFPREIFPMSAVAVCFVDFAVASVVLVAMMVYYGATVGASLICLPLIFVVQTLFTLGVALLLAKWNLFYRDVKYVFEVLIVVWMFATSVVYPVAAIEGRLGLIMRLNPVTPIIEAYRAVLLEGRWPDVPALAAVTVFSVVLAAAAWVSFHRSEFEFAENV